jgi:hypothetical protein
VLPVVLLVGLATIFRLGAANAEDSVLVGGMNRLRHGYLELAPELEPYFITGRHDDRAGIMQTYGMGPRMSLTHLLAGTPNLVAAINIVVFGVFVALVAQTLGASDQIVVIAGLIAGVVAAVSFVAWAGSTIRRARRAYHPRFPR